jgi:tetratricopeptide (TPR) repeat protein
MSIDSPAPFVQELQERYNTNRESLIPRQDVTVHSVSPRSVGFRTIAGMEFDLGSAVRFALGGMYDVTSGSFVSALGFRYAHGSDPDVRPRPKPKAAPKPSPKKAKASKAKQHQDRGRKAFKRKKFRRALEYFELAYAADASIENMYFLARTHEEMKRPKKAIRWFKKYVAKAPAGAKRADVKKRLAALKAKRGR